MSEIHTTQAVHPLDEFDDRFSEWQGLRSSGETYDAAVYEASATDAIQAFGILPKEAFETNYEEKHAAELGIGRTEFMMERAADVVAEARQAGFDPSASIEDQQRAATNITLGYGTFVKHTRETGEPPEDMSSEEYERWRRAKELLVFGTARLLGHAPAGEIAPTRAHEFAGQLGAKVVASEAGVVLAPGDDR